MSGKVLVEKVAEKAEGKTHNRGSHAEAVELRMGLGMCCLTLEALEISFQSA